MPRGWEGHAGVKTAGEERGRGLMRRSEGSSSAMVPLPIPNRQNTYKSSSSNQCCSFALHPLSALPCGACRGILTQRLRSSSAEGIDRAPTAGEGRAAHGGRHLGCTNRKEQLDCSSRDKIPVSPKKSVLGGVGAAVPAASNGRGDDRHCSQFLTIFLSISGIFQPGNLRTGTRTRVPGTAAASTRDF